MKRILLLGATGSIGSQTLDIIEKEKDNFTLVGAAFNRNIKKFTEVLKRFPDLKYIGISNFEAGKELQKRYPDKTIYIGETALKELIYNTSFDMAVNSLVGFSGLAPSIEILKKNKILLLANKESLVTGGEIIEDLLGKGHGQLYPIDSEHVAISKCLMKAGTRKVKKLVLTASGGAFRNKTPEELKHVTFEDALKHPTWKMGYKITIDSATLMNKAFEVMEAHYLFNYPIDDIDILLHYESMLHSYIVLEDGTLIGEVNKPDMHGPIFFALHEGNVPLDDIKEVKKLEDFGPYTYIPFNKKEHPLIDFVLLYFKKGNVYPTVINGANEEAIELFKEGKISYLEIAQAIRCAAEHFTPIIKVDLPSLTEEDKASRLFVRKLYA